MSDLNEKSENTPDENSPSEETPSTEEETSVVPSAEEVPEVKLINITQLPEVISGVLRNRTPPGLLTPTDLGFMYKLFLYEYIDHCHHDKAVEKAKKLTEKKKDVLRAYELGRDSDLNLPTDKIRRMLEIYYNGVYNAAFDSKGFK